MFDQYLFDAISTPYHNKIILYDDEQLLQLGDYLYSFKKQGFQIISYQNDLEFRKHYKNAMRDQHKKLLIIAKSSQYIPYDIQKCCFVKSITISNLFPGLTITIFNKYMDVDLDLLSLAYKNSTTKPDNKDNVKKFFSKFVLSKENINHSIKSKLEKMHRMINQIKFYADWFYLAERKSEIDKLAVKYQLKIDTSWISKYFSEWLLANFGKLSTEISKKSPVLLSKAMDFMKHQSDKFVIVIMDGMSEFDWSIMKKSFSDINYQKTSAFAMIPTVTAVSRQCLLSGKYPNQLQSPWNQQKEESEFKACAKGLGFNENQLYYGRGYDNDLKASVKCAAIIINDIDDMVHGQIQERVGMYNGLTVMAQYGKLARMVKKYIKQKFDVYITSDHGNTPCVGIGKYHGAGVETTTKSRRMMVVNDLADKDSLMAKYPLVEFPKYYLDKNYTYLICEGQSSYDCKDETVMSHGGITIDEVIVPFIQVITDHKK